MVPAKEIAEQFKKEAFFRLDHSKGSKPKMIYVDANKLIDLCLAYKCAAVGDVSNLEYSLKVLYESKEKLLQAMNDISVIVDVESIVYELANNHGVY